MIYLLVQGIRYVRPSLLVTHPTVSLTNNNTGGFLDPLLGTILVALVAMVLATPVGIAIAVWLSEYGRPAPLARIAESTIEMLAGAPSIVLALFGALLFESPLLGFLSQTSGGVVYGRSFFAAGAMLSLVALPLVVDDRPRRTAGDPHARARGLLRGREDEDRHHSAGAPAGGPAVGDHRGDAGRRPRDRGHRDHRRAARRDPEPRGRRLDPAAEARCAAPAAR